MRRRRVFVLRLALVDPITSGIADTVLADQPGDPEARGLVNARCRSLPHQRGILRRWPRSFTPLLSDQVGWTALQGAPITGCTLQWTPVRASPAWVTPPAKRLVSSGFFVRRGRGARALDRVRQRVLPQCYRFSQAAEVPPLTPTTILLADTCYGNPDPAFNRAAFHRIE